MMSGKANFLGGLVSGAAIGLIAGLLAAPSSGKQARKKLKKKTKKYSKEAIQAVRQYLGGKTEKKSLDKSVAAAESGRASSYND